MATKADSASTDDEVEEEYHPGAFEEIFGDSTRTRVIRYLANNPDESHRQVDISDAVDASQPMVSRAIAPMRENEIVIDTDDGIMLASSRPAKAMKRMVDQFSGVLE